MQNKVMDYEFLLKIQIEDSCRLAVPDGLKDLMGDISREVLRAQPKNILLFITKYLAALLVTRENMTYAKHICDDMCEHLCAAGLEEELRYKGFNEDVIEKVKEIVDNYMTKAGAGQPIKEGNLMCKILKETTLNVDRIEDIQEAVRRAFIRYIANNTTTYEVDQVTPNTSLDSVNRAVQHTLDLYHNTDPREEEYERAALKIGAAYRSYGVKRTIKDQGEDRKEYLPNYHDPKLADAYSEISLPSDDTIQNKQVAFVGAEPDHTEARSEAYSEHIEARSEANSEVTNVSEKTDEVENFYVHATRSFHRLIPPGAVTTVSSTSLAGSLLNLPTYKPYTAFEELQELPDEEDGSHPSVEYTTTAGVEMNVNRKEDLPRESVEEKCFDYAEDYESDDVGSSMDDEETYVIERVIVDQEDSVSDIDEIPEDIHERKLDSIP